MRYRKPPEHRPTAPSPYAGRGTARITHHLVTILSIDPGTHSLGYAFWTDGTLLDANYLDITAERPSAALASIIDFFDTAKADAVVCERMFVNAQFGGNSARLLNVIPDELEWWAKERGMAFAKLANSTIKKAVTGRGDAKKDLVYSYVQHLWPALAEIPKTHRYDVSDAIAIGIAAMKKGVFPEPPLHA